MFRNTIVLVEFDLRVREMLVLLPKSRISDVIGRGIDIRNTKYSIHPNAVFQKKPSELYLVL